MEMGIFARASVFGIVAAFFYAFQHPLAKPLFDHIGLGIGSMLLGLFTSATANLVAGAALLSVPSIRADVRGIFASDGAWRKIFTLTLIGLASGTMYIVSVSRANAVYLAIILNFFPFWYGVVGSLFFKRQIGRNAWIILGIACLGIFGPQIYYQPLESPLMLAGQFILISTVPILYATSAHYQQHAFGHLNTFSYILASALIDAPIFMIVALVGLYWFPSPTGFEGLLSSATVAFVIGSLMASLVGRWLFQRGVAESRGNAQFVAIFFFLVPFFVGIIGEMLPVVGFHTDAKFNTSNIAGIAVLASCIIIQYIMKVSKKY